MSATWFRCMCRPRRNRDMIGERELRAMKKGSYLINASRSNVVAIDALARAISDGHLLGTAVDVFAGQDRQQSKKKIFLKARCAVCPM